MSYIGNIPVPQATQTRDRFTATSGQTTFSTSGYTPGFLDVYLNGVHLDASDYTATNGSDVVLDTGAATDDIVEVVAFTAFEVATVDFTDLLNTPTTISGYGITDAAALAGANFTGAVDVDSTLTANTLALDNGSNDWTFEVDTNKLIIKYAGTAKMELDTSGNLKVTGNVTAYGTI